jgi:predicted nucleic acid-binding protein
MLLTARARKTSFESYVMPIGRFRYCWDSCVFISLLTGSGRTPEEMEKLRQMESLADIGAITIFTPATTLIEVLACKLTDQQEIAFGEVLQRSNILAVSVTMRIAERAREIRNHYRIAGHEIAVPDAIHLATALIYGATALHTYDGCGKRPKHTDLLKLITPLIGKYPITICKPEPPLLNKPEAPIPNNATSGNLFEGLNEQEKETN